jgi:hypothetical protein
MNVEWRPIPGYEGYYEASDTGLIRSVDRVVTRVVGGRCIEQPVDAKVLSPGLNVDNGYLYVSLSRDGRGRSFSVQVLIALTFIGPRPHGLDVRHGDGVKINNTKENLCYGTRRENHLDKRRHGTSPQGERGPTAKLTESQVLEIRKHIEAGLSLGEMAKIYPVSKSAIQSIRDGRTWVHLGPVRRYQADRPVEAISEA